MTETMAARSALDFSGRNPDVLSCIANLSSDEVFTPPKLANQMLDVVEQAWAESHSGASIWADSGVRFLDPFTKSGVFLREITKRLVDGLTDEIPDLSDRVDHILTRQVYGIGITELTALLARRSLYCSKWADGEHSIATSFDHPDGNIWFQRTEHTWVGGTKILTADENGKQVEKTKGGKCKFCGTGQTTLDRGGDLESHAYAFIHTDDINTQITELFGDDMQFDVIIGNPPYQLDDGGQGASAIPIYNRFVEQAKLLEPRFLSMVIPARWLFGGRGLDRFRKDMLEDDRVRHLVDYSDSRQVFRSVDVAGGICYFVWDRDGRGDCKVVTHDARGLVTAEHRRLLEPGAEVFIRSGQTLSVLRKVVEHEAGKPGVVLPESVRFERQVSSQKPFGLRTYYRGSDKRSDDTDVVVLQSGGRAWAQRSAITEGTELIDKWKVFTSKSSSEHAGQADKNGMRRVLSLTGVLAPGSVVTETYVLLGVFDTEAEARNCLSYVLSKFFRFLVAARTSAQDLPRSAYSFVPIQDYSRPWTDSELYKKYGFTVDEVNLVDSSVREMAAASD